MKKKSFSISYSFRSPSLDMHMEKHRSSGLPKRSMPFVSNTSSVYSGCFGCIRVETLGLVVPSIVFGEL